MDTKERQEVISAIKRANIEIWDVESQVFEKTEEKIKHIANWFRTPKEKRKPAVNEWTASPERQVGYIIESLEYHIKKLEKK